MLEFGGNFAGIDTLIQFELTKKIHQSIFPVDWFAGSNVSGLASYGQEVIFDPDVKSFLGDPPANRP